MTLKGVQLGKYLMVIADRGVQLSRLGWARGGVQGGWGRGYTSSQSTVVAVAVACRRRACPFVDTTYVCLASRGKNRAELFLCRIATWSLTLVLFLERLTPLPT